MSANNLYSAKKAVLIGGGLTLAAGISSITSPGTVFADSDMTTDVSITIPASCTYSATTNGEYQATITPGNYNGNIGNNTFNIVCNDSNGYSVYAIGYSGDTYGNTNMINSSANATIATGTAITGGTSSWSMMLSAVSGTYAPTISNGTSGTENFTTFHAVPSSYTKVATFPSITDHTTGSSFQSKYRVYVSESQAPGAYVGKVKYVLVHPASSVAGTYTIAYNANGGTGTMSSSTNVLNFESFTLPDSTFTAPSGYQFAGWCTTPGTSPYTTCSGTSYSAGDSVTSLATAGSTVNLYAVWKKLYFQNATSAQCGQTMYDDRGTDAYKNIAYTTATIDGLCWMTRNLDLPGGTTLTPADSNVTSNYPLPASSTSGFDNDSTAYVYNSNSTTCGNNQPCYSYYSYAAATAGINPSSGEATSDICPKGWRLPTQAEYNTLIGTYTTGATLTASPFNGVYAGYYRSSSFYNGGSYGYYWSSTADMSSLAYYLYFNSSLADTNHYYKKNGYPIRCVKDTTMQEVTTTQLNTLLPNTGDTMTLKDSRDNQKYTVGKLADGNVWLLDNLALDLINTDITDLKGKTNASDTSLEYLKGIRTGTTSDQYPTAGVTTFTSANNYSIPNMISSGTCYDSNCANDPTTGNWTKDSVVGAIANSKGYNKIGIYYNYCAASAGTYCWGNGTSYTGSPEADPNSGSLIDIDGDICPLGWRMPISIANGEYQALYSAYSSDYTDFRRALSTPLSGYYFRGSARYQSDYGYFWSSTWNDTGRMRILNMNTSNIYPIDGNYRYYGFSVRCIKD